MNWWFWSYIALMILMLGVDLERHGKAKTGNHSAFSSIIGYTIQAFLMVMMLRHGGF